MRDGSEGCLGYTPPALTSLISAGASGVPEEWSDGWASRWLQQGYRPVQSAQYTYQDVNGHDVVRKTRFSLMRVESGADSGEKTFVVQHRTLQSVILKADKWEPGIGKEGWEKGLLYGRPGLEKGIDAGDDIYLCEGERDADTVAKWGGCATSHYQGAAGMRPDQAEVLARARRVFIMTDRDVTGYQLAWHHLNLLVEAGMKPADIVVVLPGVRQDKADITDHAKAKLGPEKLVVAKQSSLRRQIEKHGPLPKGGRRGWGYGYGDDDLGEWKVTHG